MSAKEEVARRIIEGILSGRIENREQVQRSKLDLAREFGLSGLPSSLYVLSRARSTERERVLPLLMKKPTRTASGVSIIAVQTSPLQSCPGNCIYCPSFSNAAKSYTGHEPASMRAIQCAYRPGRQVSTRLEQLRAMGHEVSKIELIVQGATFPAMDAWYRRWFVARCLDAMIDFGNPESRKRTLGRAKMLSQEAEVRPVGITFETRPDFCDLESARLMLHMGATRVEMGVQTLDDEIYDRTQRGHAVADVSRAFKALRSGGLKICAHMMLGLPGSSRQTDITSFQRLFNDSRFKPDELKIYPTLVIMGTRLYEMWRSGDYTPLTDEQVMDRLLQIKREVPPWVRIKRVMRDIPSQMISAGPRRSDMRNLVQRAMEKKGTRCRCIRCREVTRAGDEDHRFEVTERSYPVQGGQEVFLSFEDPESETLASFLRLSLAGDEARIRELHTYGRVVGVGDSPSPSQFQHRGMGRELVQRAEEICADGGNDLIQVTSGLGAREYYRDLGYRLKEPYMVKELSA